MLRLLVVAFVLASVTAGAVAAPGDWYQCRLPGGSTIVRDNPPQACDGIVEIYVLNHDGTPMGVIPPRLTEAQKQAKEEKERKDAECHAQNEARKRADDAMLQRYPSEDNLMRDRDAVIGRELARLDKQAQRLMELAEERKDLAGEVEFYAKREMPASLKVRLDDNETAKTRAEHEREVIGSRIKSIAADFDAVLARYRALRDGTAKYPCERPVE